MVAVTATNYDSISNKQRVRKYMDYDLHTSDEDSNSRKDFGKGESPGREDGHNKRDGR